MPLQDKTAEKMLNNAAEFIAATLAKPDQRAWDQLLIYCPREVIELRSNAVGAGAVAMTAHHSSPVTETPYDGWCYYCGEMTNHLAGNPGKWPLLFCHGDKPGVTRWHHTGCVTERLRDSAQSARDDGRVPERETWWLAERLGHGLYAADRSELPGLTNDPWRAVRFKTEREAFDFILQLATLRDEMRQTEHVFINKFPLSTLTSTECRAPELLNETSRDWDVCNAVDAYRSPRNEGDERTLSDFLEEKGLRVCAFASPQSNIPTGE